MKKKSNFCRNCRVFNKCSHLRIYKGYFLGHVNVAVQDTLELSFGAMCTAQVTHIQTGTGWDRLRDAESVLYTSGMATRRERKPMLAINMCWPQNKWLYSGHVLTWSSWKKNLTTKVESLSKRLGERRKPNGFKMAVEEEGSMGWMPTIS